MRILPDNKAFTYMGRIDFSDSKLPMFIYAGSNVEIKFKSKKIGFYITNEKLGNYCSVGAVLDGVQFKFPITEDDKELYIDLTDSMPSSWYSDQNGGWHSLTIFKRQGAANYLKFGGIEIDEDGEVALPEKNYALNIEVFGDSVSAGEITEAIYNEGTVDNQSHTNGIHDNSWFSYPMMLSRRLNANVNNNSQGGIALLNKTGFFNGPEPENLLGVETTYDKLSYVPFSKEGFTPWDFSRFTPDLIILAIGQNDPNPFQEKTETPEHIKLWKDTYKKLILSLREKYNKPVKVMMILTVLMHDPRWDKYLDEIEEELADENIKHFKFTRCGQVTPGHPRATEQSDMATELCAEIKKWCLQ